MAARWIDSFRDIAWAKVRSAAPALVEAGRKLWNSVASRDTALPRVTAEAGPASVPETLSALEVRVISLESRIKQLSEEATASFEVVKSITAQHSQLAEQQAQLVGAVDVLLLRTRALLWACAGLAIAMIVVVVVALAR